MIEVVERAWYWLSDEHKEFDPSDRVCHGETLSKAKYALYKELNDIGWCDSFRELLSFKFRRFPVSDKVRIPREPILDMLTSNQRDILFHANGNNGRTVGYRDYYYANSDCHDCNVLVASGLMRKGKKFGDHSYFILTNDGKRAAMSGAVILRHQADDFYHIYKECAPVCVEHGMLSLEALRNNKRQLEDIGMQTCRIFSGQWGYYWRSGGCGYCKKDEAGIFTLNDAFNRTSHCGIEKGIYFEFVEDGE